MPINEEITNECMQELVRVENVVKGVCPHAQYCGNFTNDYYGNGTPHEFTCGKSILEFRPRGGLIMMEPFTDEQLKIAFKQYCIHHYGETCETAQCF